MLENFVSREDILLKERCSGWEDAVDRGAQPLLKRGVIEPAYVEAIKANHRSMPYMVIAPGIMLAHARPECGAKGMGLTLMTLSSPVKFGSALNDPVQFVITLATPDETKHLKMLEALTEFLMEQDCLEKFLTAQTVTEAMGILKGDEEK